MKRVYQKTKVSGLEVCARALAPPVPITDLPDGMATCFGDLVYEICNDARI